MSRITTESDGEERSIEEYIKYLKTLQIRNDI